MASAPSDRGPVLGRVDAAGRLISADPDLAALQTDAGSHVGAQLALPQIAAIARLARRLRVPVNRQALVGGADHDVELWVRATPEGDEVALSLEQWKYRPPAQSRLAGIVGHEREAELGGAPDEWATDEELKIASMSVSLAERLGIDASEAVGQPLTRLFRLEENDSGDLPLLSAVASRSDFDDQPARVRGDGEIRYRLRAVAIVGADGRFAGFKGEATAEEEEVQPATEESIDAALDEALRSPLDRIIESADRIVEQAEGPLRSDYADYASDIAAAARHLLSVIRAMNGEAANEEERAELTSAASEAAALVEPAAEARRVSISLEPSVRHVAAAEFGAVVQILVNLIGNAVRHSPAGGTVSVSFERSAGQSRVHVADQGSGIDESDQQRIFERFEQAKAAEGGTGLGLAIARRLARGMGGDISLESAPGEGAVFTLSLRSV